MSELKYLKEIEKINIRVAELEKMIRILPDWITLKNASNHLPVTRQALYKKVVDSGRYKPGQDFKKDGKYIYISLNLYRQFADNYHAAA
jgi:predicted DNA-binding protein (UPF0251 family)